MLNNDDHIGPQFLCLHGQAGTGKSIMMRKISALARSKGKLISMCASTNLAALCFPNCTTAHSLFGYPVLENPDVNDAVDKIECNPSNERRELLAETNVIIWDEVFVNHHDLFDAVVELMKDNQRLIIVITGDGRQCPVVVPFGNVGETIAASMISSPHWNKFTVVIL